MSETSNAGMPPMPYLATQPFTGFRQFNLGHLINLIALIASGIGLYSSGQANARHTEDVLEQVQIAQKAEHEDEQRMNEQIAALQLQEASSQQDRLDLHHTIEDDFSRRLGKVEDRFNK